MRSRMIIHLKDGTALYGKWGELSKSDIAEIHDAVSSALSSSAGWQLNVETDTDWVCAPKDSVNYVSMETEQ